MPKSFSALSSDIFGRRKAHDKAGQLEMRVHVFTSSCELFLMRATHSQTEIAQFAELFEHLSADIPLEVAAPLAERLVGHRSTPVSVIAALRQRGMISAEALIATSHRLPDEFVESLLVNPHGALAARLATRADLAEATIDRLGASADYAVQVALVQNHKLKLPGALIETLLAGAHRHQPLAAALVLHPDVKLDARLYLAYGREQRDAVILRALRRQMGTSAANAPRDALQQAKVQRLERQMIKRDLAAAVTTCAEILQLPIATLAPLMRDDESDGMVLALRAAGLERPGIVRVALSGPQRVAHDYSEIWRIARMADQIEEATAATLLHEITGTPSLATAPVAGEVTTMRRDLAALRPRMPERGLADQPLRRLFNRKAEG
ncbi:MAG: hypothetical protein KGQ37_04890 [Hyphomicrobiales bacterium]|nr:hypothetical protein [Hyphomicrobiales bacterium]